MGKCRCKQIERCYFKLHQKPDVPATLRNEKGHLAMIFIPQDELEAYKEKYGEKLEIWDWLMPERRSRN